MRDTVTRVPSVVSAWQRHPLDPGSDVLAETRVWHESSDAFWGVLGSPATSITSTRVALIPGGGSNDIARRFLRGTPPESPLQYGRPRHTQPRQPPIQHPVGNRSRRDPLPRWRTERVRYMPSSRCLIRVIPQLRHALTLRLCDLPHHDHGVPRSVPACHFARLTRDQTS